jgi:hypothetical protein
MLTADEIKQIEDKAEELSISLKTKVHIYCSDDEEKVVAFFKEPNYTQKLYAMGKMTTVDPFMAANELRGILTIKEETDPRCMDGGEDKYILGLTVAIIPVIEVAANAFKKK